MTVGSGCGDVLAGFGCERLSGASEDDHGTD